MLRLLDSEGGKGSPHLRVRTVAELTTFGGRTNCSTGETWTTKATCCSRRLNVFQRFQHRLNVAVSSTEQNVQNIVVDLHVDRNGDKGVIDGGLQNLIVATSHESSGTINTIAGLTSNLSLGDNNGGNGGTASAYSSAISVLNGYVIQNLYGSAISISGNGAAGNITMQQMNSSVSAANNIEMMNGTISGTAGGSVRLLNLNSTAAANAATCRFSMAIRPQDCVNTQISWTLVQILAVITQHAGDVEKPTLLNIEVRTYQVLIGAFYYSSELLRLSDRWLVWHSWNSR